MANNDPTVNPQMGEAGDEQELTLRERVVRWIVRGSVAGFVVSVAVHVAFLIAAAFWQLGTAQAGGGTGHEGKADVEMAIMTEAELGAIEEASLEVKTPAIAETVPETMPSPEILDGPSASGEAPGPDDIGKVSESMTGAGGDIGDSVGTGETGAGSGGAAKFFGVEAVGTRFAYIVDISGSMQGPKLRAMKIELIESTSALLEHMQFYVVFFSSDSNPMGGRTRWTRADETGKSWARDRTNEVNAFGGTNPLTAFQLVFDLTPRPDAIYFMTDGLFDAETAKEVARMNKRGKRVPIHTIGFDMQSDDAVKLLKQIAEESGGRYSPVGFPGDKR